jgi:hypothetical protein
VAGITLTRDHAVYVNSFNKVQDERIKRDKPKCGVAIPLWLILNQHHTFYKDNPALCAVFLHLYFYSFYYSHFLSLYLYLIECLVMLSVASHRMTDLATGNKVILDVE